LGLPRLKHKTVKKIREKEEKEKRKSGTPKRENQALINLKKMGKAIAILCPQILRKNNPDNL
jgi:hypothetical protein